MASRNGLGYVGALEPVRRTRLTNWRYDQVVLADAPSAYWRLGERAGTTAVDLVAANNGTYSGTYTLGAPGALAGDGDGAIAIGAAAYGRMRATAIATGASVWTLEAWFNPSALPNQADGIIFGNGTLTTNGYSFAVNGGGPAGSKFQVGINGVAWFDTGYTFPAINTWYHLCATRDGTTMRPYVNGVACPNTSVTAFVAPTTYVLLGTYDTSARLAGIVDECAIYATTLPASRIWEHYRAGVKGDH